MLTMQPALRAGLLATALALAGCGSMSMSSNPHFSASLSAAMEVPPNDSTGSGTLDATLDSKTQVLSWTLNYTGLSGPATAAHIHGPAAAGTNAGVVVPFPNPTSPYQGQATLTPAQVADLTAGKWYVNVHTAAHPGGELRGQITAK